MTRKSVGLWVLVLIIHHTSFSQVDTTYIYKTGTPYGTLDLRIAKSATRYYYLDEGKTFSFRESAPGVKTNSFRDMTSWDSSPYTQGNLREKNGNADAFIMNYRLLFPVGYNANIPDGYPLILMMHGLGERGNCWDNTCHWADRSWRPSTNNPPALTGPSEPVLNNDHNLLHGGSIHLGARNLAGSKLPNDPTLPSRSFPGFVLFPQNLNGWSGGEAQDAIRIIRLLVKKYKIDPDRIYVHGLSNGGGYVYDVIKKAPWLFTASATMSAISDGGIIAQGLTSSVSSVSMWFFQGGRDTSPSPARTEGYVKKFREAGLSVRYTKYESVGHGTWNLAYKEPDFFTYFRSKSKADIHVYADNPTLCATTGEGVKMDLAPGFLAYQWEKNGVIIPGATSPYYTATSTGTYRARFSRKSSTPSEAQWNEWSKPVTVISSSPVQAQIEQKGTVVLNDLNNYGFAHLSSATKDDHYYWYKNGTLIDLAGGEDDTTRFAKFSATNGPGVYTLVTAGFNNCPTPESEPKYIFFANQAPVNIIAPTNFAGNATSGSTATVSWTDGSSNENGFEIWRRKQIGTTTFSPWVMAKITSANTTTLNDVGLEPSSTYQYKIRAVGNTGRSEYTPLAANQFLTIVTQSDTQNPTVPQNLVATSTAIKEITLTWQASTDNTGIREYVINYGTQTINTGSSAPTYKLKNLPLNTNYTFTVRARDLGGNLSGLSNAASASTVVTGLYYEHSTGAFTDIDLINWNAPEFTGKVDNFTLNPRTQEDYFNFEFEGYLHINTGGAYQFQTSSDDGSRLTLNGAVVVDNDGLHGTRTITSAVTTLTSGPQVINVKYFENASGQNLTVRYKGPDTGEAFIVIPNSALRSGDAGTTMAGASEAEIVDLDQNEMNLSVYPNPLESTDELTVQMAGTEVSPVRVKIFDYMGNTYYDNTLDGNDVVGGVKVATSEKLQKGIYVVLIQQGKRSSRKVLMVND